MACGRGRVRLGRFLVGRPTRAAASALYRAVVRQARQAAFYDAGGVPDTLDGRFELIALHAFLVLRRLKAERPRTRNLAQALFDEMFADMDRSLREMGAGDLGVGRRVKAMAAAFYGRVAAYERGLAEGDETLQAALARNLFGTVAAERPKLAAMGGYLKAQVALLDRQPIDRLAAGEVRFAPF